MRRTPDWLYIKISVYIESDLWLIHRVRINCENCVLNRACYNRFVVWFLDHDWKNVVAHRLSKHHLFAYFVASCRYIPPFFLFRTLTSGLEICGCSVFGVADNIWGPGTIFKTKQNMGAHRNLRFKVSPRSFYLFPATIHLH